VVALLQADDQSWSPFYKRTINRGRPFTVGQPRMENHLPDEP